MIKGLDIFKEYFSDFNEQYVIIGGAACDIVFNDADLSFRATKDIDMVLIVEALTPEFGRRFWDFVGAGGYENRAKSNGVPQFYRFDKPKTPGFPFMIELFARSESMFDNDIYVCRPLYLGEEISGVLTAPQSEWDKMPPSPHISLTTLISRSECRNCRNYVF
jgi:hypothetical protein